MIWRQKYQQKDILIENMTTLQFKLAFQVGAAWFKKHFQYFFNRLGVHKLFGSSSKNV